MLRIGLTGGIGSGKSTVAGIFEVLGIPVSHADETARSLMNEDEALRQRIVDHFGAQSYAAGQLNRSWLAAQVFTDPQKLELLNALVHPVTLQASEKWMEEQRGKGAPYALKEAALIFESRAAQGLDYVIGVRAPVALRILRTMRRDNIPREKVIERMKNQLSEEMKMKLCDFLIDNDEQHALLPQVLELHARLLELATSVLRERP